MWKRTAGWHQTAGVVSDSTWRWYFFVPFFICTPYIFHLCRQRHLDPSQIKRFERDETRRYVQTVLGEKISFLAATEDVKSWVWPDVMTLLFYTLFPCRCLRYLNPAIKHFIGVTSDYGWPNFGVKVAKAVSSSTMLGLLKSPIRSRKNKTILNEYKEKSIEPNHNFSPNFLVIIEI